MLAQMASSSGRPPGFFAAALAFAGSTGFALALAFFFTAALAAFPAAGLFAAAGFFKGGMAPTSKVAWLLLPNTSGTLGSVATAVTAIT